MNNRRQMTFHSSNNYKYNTVAIIVLVSPPQTCVEGWAMKKYIVVGIFGLIDRWSHSMRHQQNSIPHKGCAQ